MSEKAALGKKAIVIFIMAIIIEIIMIAINIPVESLLANGEIGNDLSTSKADNWEKEDIPTTENNATKNILMKDDTCEYSDSDYQYHGTVFGSEISRDRVVSVAFLNTLDAMTDRAWDVSREQNGTVMAWIVPDASVDQGVDLFIGAEGKILAEDCKGLLRGYGNVVTIGFNDCFDTSNVKDMGSMFQYCENLAQLDVSSFDTSQVENMSNMFGNCISLKMLDLGSFDTSQVTDMVGMFEVCLNMRQLDINNFNTSRVINMSGMFNSCYNLTQLDVSNFDTSQATDMSGMFTGCEALTQLDISNFDTGQVIDMSGMFTGCESLIQLDISNFDTSQVKNMGSMFWGCESLTQLDVSNFIMSQGIWTDHMFEDCAITAEEANLGR